MSPREICALVLIGLGLGVAALSVLGMFRLRDALERRRK